MKNLCDDHAWSGEGECPKCSDFGAGLVPAQAEAVLDTERLDWLEQHEDGYYNLDRVASIVGTGFLTGPLNPILQKAHATLREAIDSARGASAPAQEHATQLAGPGRDLEVTDEMALAFHRAISDGAIGQEDVDESKAGLRAAMCNVAPAQEHATQDSAVEWAGYKPLLASAIAAKDAMLARGIRYDRFDPMFAEFLAKVDAAHQEHATQLAGQGQEARPGFALVPLRLTRAMDRVMQDEGWRWEDLLAAANAVTEDEYESIANDRLSKDEVREVFRAHGFTIKPGQSDLKPYVYEAAEELEHLVRTRIAAEPETTNKDEQA